jgi:hypothetical protein
MLKNLGTAQEVFFSTDPAHRGGDQPPSCSQKAGAADRGEYRQAAGATSPTPNGFLASKEFATNIAKLPGVLRKPSDKG